MSLKWEKLGQIFVPKNQSDWMVSHAALPFAYPLGDQDFRIYFSTRDKQNRSNIGFVEINLSNPHKILRISEKPVLEPGTPGYYDDSGCGIGCIVKVRGREFFYYMGWNNCVTVPWRNSIGLAIKNQSGEFVKFSKAPVVDRADCDPFNISYPYVLEDGAGFKMWYGSNLTWGSEHKDMAHCIKYAESQDGIHWQRDGHIAIPFQNEAEYAMSCPSVIKETHGPYRMWYSFRGAAYRIGYAESSDGKNWQRKDDQVGIGVSASGWDSEMVEYPNVFKHDGNYFMLYNGNSYGLTGFGLAFSKG